MKQTIENFQLLKSEIRKVEKEAKLHTGKTCFLAGMSFSVDPKTPDWVDAVCEMDDVHDGSFCCDVSICCYMLDRRRSFIVKTAAELY